MKKPTLAPAYVLLFPGLAELAQSKGYALAIHGSVSTDLDFVAAPWTDEAVSAEELAMAFFDYAKLFGGQPWQAGHKILQPEKKPHGRLAWIIPMEAGSAIDLSVMPREMFPDSLLRGGVRKLLIDNSCLKCGKLKQVFGSKWCKDCFYPGIDDESKAGSYSCGVKNCGGGSCVHKLTDERCPHCGHRLVLVTTSGVKFCSAGTSIYSCDYEVEP